MKYLIFLLSFLLYFPASAFAQEKSDFNWHLNVRGQYLNEDNRDLGTKNEDPDNSFTLDSRLAMRYRPVHGLLAYFEGGAVKTFGDGMAAEDETGASRPSSAFLELRQLWLRFDKLIPNTQLQIGRQRIREDYALWWNRDLDAIRALYASDNFKGFVGVAKDLAYYRTNDPKDDDDKKLLHVLGEASFILPPQDRIEARGLYEKDDDENSKIGWAGLRLAGERSKFNYRFDGIAMRGEDTDAISGWAFDGGVDIPLGINNPPVLVLGYAYGSKEFQQSSIYGNTSKVGSAFLGLNHYGEAFRPELANLHILTAGISLPVMAGSDLNFLYHNYRMTDEDAALGGNNLKITPSGTSSALGQELDAILNISLNDEIPSLLDFGSDKNIRLSTGIFKAGDAFASASGEYSYRALAEFRIRY